MKRLRTSIFFSILFSFFCLLPAQGVLAATMFFSPSGGTHHVGDTINISVLVSSPDQSMNAVAGDVIFSGDTLEATGVSKNGSIISLWVQNPSFSNATHKAHFEGVSFNPGYKGSGGRIISFSFRAKAAGQAKLHFIGASVLANDGSGTDILSGSGSAQYTILPATERSNVKPEIKPQISPETKPIQPTAELPVIRSSTYPNSTEWYTERNASFQWDLPQNTLGVSWVITHQSDTLPSPNSVGRVADVLVKAEGDGVWYFHVRFQTAEGWGPAGHYRFQIDTTPPDPFEILAAPRPDPTKPIFEAVIHARDANSGIDVYRVKIDQEAEMEWRDNGSHSYETRIVPPGRHQLTVTAFDKAGNSTEAKTSWVSISIDPPVIHDFIPRIPVDSWIIVKGTSFPRATITVSQTHIATNEVERQTFVTQDDGSWVYVSSNKMGVGIYKVSATVADGRGAQSSDSVPVIVHVEQPWLWFMNSATANPYSMWIIIVILILLLCLGGVYHLYSVRYLERHLLSMISDSQGSLQKRIASLKKGIVRTKNRKLLADVEELEVSLREALQEGDEQEKQ